LAIITPGCDMDEPQRLAGLGEDVLVNDRFESPQPVSVRAIRNRKVRR
jgi:hypothetical protein